MHIALLMIMLSIKNKLHNATDLQEIENLPGNVMKVILP